MPRITNPHNIKIGHYYSYCCELDLYKIESESDINDLVDDMNDDYGLIPRIWDTKESALKELIK